MNNVFSIFPADVRLDDKAEVGSDNIFYSKVIHIMSRNMIQTKFDYDVLGALALGYLHQEGFLDNLMIDEIKIYDPSGKIVSRETLIADA